MGGSPHNWSRLVYHLVFKTWPLALLMRFFEFLPKIRVNFAGLFVLNGFSAVSKNCLHFFPQIFCFCVLFLRFGADGRREATFFSWGQPHPPVAGPKLRGGGYSNSGTAIARRALVFAFKRERLSHRAIAQRVNIEGFKCNQSDVGYILLNG